MLAVSGILEKGTTLMSKTNFRQLIGLVLEAQWTEVALTVLKGFWQIVGPLH